MSSTGSQDEPVSMAVEHGQHVQRLDESIFLAIQVTGGQILLPILVLTVLFSKKLMRHPVFVNFCLSWILSSIIYSLLVYRGRSSDDELSLLPSYDTCLVQAALINGVQTLTSCTNLALIVHLWLVLRSAGNSKSSDPDVFEAKTWHIAYILPLLIIPFAVFVTFTVISVVVGSAAAVDTNTDQIIPGSNLSLPTAFYCVIVQNGNLSVSLLAGFKLIRAVYGFCVSISCITFCFEASVARTVYKHRNRSSRTIIGWRGLFIRVVLFGIYRLFSLVGMNSLNIFIIQQPIEILLVGISKNNIYNGVIDFVQASVPLVAFLIFATQKEVLSQWCVWKKWTKVTKEHRMSQSIDKHHNRNSLSTSQTLAD